MTKIRLPHPGRGGNGERRNALGEHQHQKDETPDEPEAPEPKAKKEIVPHTDEALAQLTKDQQRTQRDYRDS